MSGTQHELGTAVPGSKQPKLQAHNYERDRVYLIQLPRPTYSPNLSPYCLRVEAYLRLANIEYDSIETLQDTSIKGQWPYIELNGVQYAESSFIVKKLEEYFHKETELESHLTPQQRGIGRAAEALMLNSFVWQLVVIRAADTWTAYWQPDSIGHAIPKVAAVPPFKQLAIWSMESRLDKISKTVGVGRNTADENLWMAKRDLLALRDLLDASNFICGDKMTKYDCSIFGVLAQFYWSPQKHALLDYVQQHENCATLRQYILRIKEELWGDQWERREPQVTSSK